MLLQLLHLHLHVLLLLLRRLRLRLRLRLLLPHLRERWRSSLRKSWCQRMWLLRS